MYKFLHIKYPHYSEKIDTLNDQYRKIIKDEKFRSKYYYLYPSYTEDYPDEIYTD